MALINLIKTTLSSILTSTCAYVELCLYKGVRCREEAINNRDVRDKFNYVKMTSSR